MGRPIVLKLVIEVPDPGPDRDELMRMTLAELLGMPLPESARIPDTEMAELIRDRLDGRGRGK